MTTRVVWDDTVIELRGASQRWAALPGTASDRPVGDDESTDVVAFSSPTDLAAGVAEVDRHLPVVLVLDNQDLGLRAAPRTVAALVSSLTRINMVLVRDLDACTRLARLQVPVPVARHEGDARALRHWVRRSHAYGYVLPPRP